MINGFPVLRRFYDLPSLTSLAAFEASARHSSFKRAAQELNVTPGAVSRQIKAIEADLGQTLFRRVHRGVVLTAAGEELYAVLSRSFSHIATACRRVRDQDRGASVTIGATTAVAALWLMPRLGDFWRNHQDIALNHVISDQPHDLRLSQVDLRIRYGNGAWPDEKAEKLFDDQLYPVCGPAFAATHENLEPDGLATVTLLNLVDVDPDWTDWEEWFRRLGLSVRPTDIRNFNSYIIELQAAQDNQGAAIGWHSLVAPLVKAGKLARLTRAAIDAPGAFYVTYNANRALSPHARQLLDWLLEVARSREPDSPVR